MSDEPDVATTRAKLQRALIRAEAAAALNASGSRFVELFAPSLEDVLRIGPDDTVVVVDEDGVERRNVTVRQAAKELRDKYPTL